VTSYIECSDMVERERVSRQICSELNNFIELKDTLSTIMKRIQGLSNIEAIAVRLHDDGDYPYYVYRDFDETFIMHEKHLCAKDGHGNTILDQDGNYLLECMCGNIIKGRFDPNLPFFTKGGSFWSNHTTELLANTTETERQAHTRNYCNSCGYESVALIPIHAGNDTLGLIQLNDHRIGMFTIDFIEFLEMITNQVGLAVKNSNTFTKLKIAEAELRDKTEKLIATQEQLMHQERLATIGKIAGGMAHELRNPLGALSNSLYMLNSKLADSDDMVKKHLDIAKKMLDRSLAIVSNLLDFAMNRQPQRELVNIDNLLDEIMSRVSIGEEIEVNRSVQPDARAMFIDPGLMQVALKNIIQNAIEAMPGGGRLGITVHRDEDAIVYEITDSGIGIPSENIEKIFDPFYSTKSYGIGLGLPIAKEIIEKHGGTIEVKSENGKGSIFTIHMPSSDELMTVDAANSGNSR